MNQDMFATIFASVISTYFSGLILMYVLRTFLAHVSDESPNNGGFTPSSSEVKVGISTSSIAILPNLLAD